MVTTSGDDATTLDGALRALLGPDARFRPGQREALEATLDGKDCLAMLPTGAGKSLLYMLPAAMRAAHAEYEAAGGGGGVEEQRVLEREAR